MKNPALAQAFFPRPTSSSPLSSTTMVYESNLLELPPTEEGAFVLLRHEESNEDVGLARSDLSSGRQRLLDLMVKLFNTGVQEDIDIPQIAVVGSQSAGKSSLIEAISGITLPRASGTCTRCPTECKLTSSTEPWSCTVSLRLTKDIRGKALGEPVTVDFGPPIKDKISVEERLRRAQRAILNPSTNFRKFLDGDDEDLPKHETSFSPNCVSLQISGPGIANLSFCDLPGLIASVSGGNSGDIALVKDLVASYISKPSCIILLTVACESDFEVQGAHSLVKEYDPAGKRTIGVLTKPDRIPSGEESRWMSFLRNSDEALQHGWFCVKQPSSSELRMGITWAEARRKEDEFFSVTSPWRDLEGILQTHLKTKNLVERASSVLSNLISSRLPKIHDELQEALDETERQLRALPSEPSNDPLAEIIHVLYDFTRDLSQHVEGMACPDGLLQAFRPHQEQFKKYIRSTAPDFRVHIRSHAAHHSVPQGPAFLRDEEGEDDLSQTAMSLGMIAKPKPVYIDDVLERAEMVRTRELPDNYPFIVRASYISEITQQWRSPAMQLCDKMYKTLSNFVRKIIHHHFGSFGRGLLEQRVLSIVQDHLESCRTTTKAKVEWLLRLEERPFTLNTHYLASYKDKFLAFYKASRLETRNSALMEKIRTYQPSPTEIYHKSTGKIEKPELSGIQKILTGLVDLGITGIQPADIAKMLPADDMEPAIYIMAEIRAYFQVAYKRFADNIPLTIDRELVFGLMASLTELLQAQLHITGPDGNRICRELVQERPEIADQRLELKKRQERLLAARKELWKLEDM